MQHAPGEVVSHLVLAAASGGMAKEMSQQPELAPVALKQSTGQRGNNVHAVAEISK